MNVNVSKYCQSVDLNLRTFYRYFVLDAVHLSKELVILYKLHAVVSRFVSDQNFRRSKLNEKQVSPPIVKLYDRQSVDLNLRTFYRYFVLDAVHLSKELVILYKLHAVVSRREYTLTRNCICVEPRKGEKARVKIFLHKLHGHFDAAEIASKHDACILIGVKVKPQRRVLTRLPRRQERWKDKNVFHPMVPISMKQAHRFSFCCVKILFGV
ncbi:hypothetical protein M514_15847 [Trichuris suis]|uniref:Uncharacterized protein n=1 Tax=Trichuris suis TaxID=68888 RepID=A0A085NRP9_9BILA|nr:hypothetical protein M514_15847 [Trichuris suis]